MVGTHVHPEGGSGRDTQGAGEGERRFEKLGVAFREKLAEDPTLIAGDEMGLSDEDEETVGIIQLEGGVRPTSEADVKLVAGDSTAGLAFL